MTPRWTSRSAVVGFLVTAGLASTLLFACTNLNNLAAQTYIKEVGDTSCVPKVRARPDLESRYTLSLFEVTGCGLDVIYSCEGDTRYPHEAATNGGCGRSDSCSEPGCDSFELAARRALMKEKACPLEQVTASAHAPVSGAPPDVAASPERLRIWMEAHQDLVNAQQPRVFLLAKGCGSETVYKCYKPPGIQTIPACDPVVQQ